PASGAESAQSPAGEDSRRGGAQVRRDEGALPLAAGALPRPGQESPAPPVAVLCDEPQARRRVARGGMNTRAPERCRSAAACALWSAVVAEENTLSDHLMFAAVE